MPLATLSNFSESGYRERTRLLLSTVPSGPEAIWGLSWEELLVGHQWRGQGWRSAVRTRAELTKRLEAAQDAAGFAAAANAITSWGGLPPFSTDDLACLRTAVGALPRIDRGDAACRRR